MGINVKGNTHGIVPRSANTPGAPPVVDHWTYMSASVRALSRLPAARRWLSAASNAPSAMESVT